MRSCKLSTCNNRLPRFKDSNRHQQMGCCNAECSYAYFKQKQAEKHEKDRIALGCHRNAPKTRKTDPLSVDEKAEKLARMRQNKPHQEELTQQAVNRLVRVLGQGELCISCGETDQCEAGHFISVAAMPSLRFFIGNIYPQCRPCNFAGTRTFKRGKKPEVVRAEYERRLRIRMGDEYVDWLKGPHMPKHYSCQDLIEMRKLINQEIRRIERGEGQSRDWRLLNTSHTIQS